MTIKSFFLLGHYFHDSLYVCVCVCVMFHKIGFYFVKLILFYIYYFGFGVNYDLDLFLTGFMRFTHICEAEMCYLTSDVCQETSEDNNFCLTNALIFVVQWKHSMMSSSHKCLLLFSFE